MRVSHLGGLMGRVGIHLYVDLMSLLTGASVSLRLETMPHFFPRPSPGTPTLHHSTAPGHRAWHWATVRGLYQPAWGPAASPAWGCTH